VIFPDGEQQTSFFSPAADLKTGVIKPSFDQACQPDFFLTFNKGMWRGFPILYF